ncbi:hypothetical protein GCM10023160_21070 [Brachybacterium paraconglomeratum]|uniref:hypothetical protein n=1 Tax=Brachybacterium paraconglomeratum TaxID=173362 RepID=UPI0031E87425
MTEPETTPRRGRRARELSPEESAAREARAAMEPAQQQSAAPGLRGAVAAPSAGAAVPALRKFGRRARIIELSEDPSPAFAANPAASTSAERGSASTLTHDHDGVELGELSVTDAPEPRPAPRFDGKVLHRPERSGGRALVWLVWALIAIAFVLLLALMLTGVIGPGAASASETALLDQIPAHFVPEDIPA